jgi:hypothetical protein
MMPRAETRTQDCDRNDALVRIAQAESYVAVAELVLADTTDDANPGVAAALAVLGGIAASDAACCARLQRRPRGRSHGEAASLLGTVSPGGVAMAKDLQRLIDRKDDSHYGLSFVSQAEAQKMIGWAKRLTEAARRAVES